MLPVFDLIALSLVSCVALRQLALSFFAEIGRKRDLKRQTHAYDTDFYISVVIPVLEEQELPTLEQLIQAIDQQDYPNTQVQVHLVTNKTLAKVLPQPDQLPAQVKIWTFPEKMTSSFRHQFPYKPKGQYLTWLLNRLLAAGGPPRLFIFLDANDMIRPDFLRNVTSKIANVPIIQGYIALRKPIEGIFGWVLSLSIRLINRIDNAGRHHANLSAQLLSSGWVIRQELLEMIPYQLGQDTENLEYTALLNLQGYHVSWAPNVVIFKDLAPNWNETFQTLALTALNRIRLVFQYGLPLALSCLKRPSWRLVESIWSLIKFPTALVVLFSCAMTFLTLSQGTSTTTNPQATPFLTNSWYSVTIALLGAQVLSMVVARCAFKDLLVATWKVPTVSLMGSFMTALWMFKLGALDRLMPRRHLNKQQRVGKRFDERRPALGALDDPFFESIPARSLDTPHTDPFLDFVPGLSQTHTEPIGLISTLSQPTRFSPAWQTDGAAPQDAEPLFATEEELFQKHFGPTNPMTSSAAPVTVKPAAPTTAEPQAATSAQVQNTIESVLTLPLTNGRQAVNSQVRVIEWVLETQQSFYQLAFEYKGMTLTTERAQHLFEAFDDLQRRLTKRGFSIMACGSCAYFSDEAPTTPAASSAACGACLFDTAQPGQIPPQVTAVTPICPHYLPFQPMQGTAFPSDTTTGAIQRQR